MERGGPVSAETPTTGSLVLQNHNELFNNLSVTPTLEERKTDGGQSIANSDSKGSVKGFLRKATRMIEKRTGIDATTDGDLLIGVVAVKLK
mgnify:CR=1 FL=1